MKILYLITKSELGGAQSHLYELCNYFNKENEVVVMSCPGGWLEEECNKMGVKFISGNYFTNSLSLVKLLKALKEIKKVIKKEKPDIMHCHSSAAGFFGRLAVKNRIPTLYTAHGWGFNIGVPFFQKWVAIFLEKLVSKYCEKIICVSGFVKKLGLKYKIAESKKFEVIYNGVEIESKVHKLKNDNKIKIIFVGRLAEPKDPLVLLKAYQKLDDELKAKAEIFIVGDGPKKGELELYLEQNELKGVRLSGGLPRGQVFDIMRESDLFVLISKYEGLPISILEAMSVGLPIVSSDVGGVKEIVDNEVNGFLLGDNDIEELKNKLEKLIKNKDLREKMGRASREKVLEKFSLDKMLKETNNLYKKVLEK